jgi:hypothetical protein
MFFIKNKKGFLYLRDEFSFFNPNRPIYVKDNPNNWQEKHAYVLETEIYMSQLILKKNWNINCLLPLYRDKDYRTIKHNINPTGADPYYPNAYFGKTIQPEDVIFFKNNRF